MQDARTDEWVRLRDARLRCDVRVDLERGSYITAESAEGTPFSVSVGRDAECAAVQARMDGVFLDVPPRLLERLRTAGMRWPGGVTPRRLCTDCGPSEELLGIAVTAVFIAVGLFLVLEGTKMRRNSAPRPGVGAGGKKKPPAAGRSCRGHRV